MEKMIGIVQILDFLKKFLTVNILPVLDSSGLILTTLMLVQV